MGKKILLIEDEDFIRDLYKRQFEKAGFTVDGFAKGKEGLDASTKNQYDLLLLDIMLPDINGIEILKQVKQNSFSKNMPVVMLTNLGQDSVIKEGFTLGAEGYLIKASFTPDQVVQEATNILNQAQAKNAIPQNSATLETPQSQTAAEVSSPQATTPQVMPTASTEPQNPNTQS